MPNSCLLIRDNCTNYSTRFNLRRPRDNTEYTLEAFRGKLSTMNDVMKASFKCEEIADDRLRRVPDSN